MRLTILTLILLLLAACGGGNPDDTDQTVIPARCGDNPKACT